MGRRLAPVVDTARIRAHDTGLGLLRTTLRGGRPALSPDERRRRRRERKRRERAAKKGVSAWQRLRMSGPLPWWGGTSGRWASWRGTVLSHEVTACRRRIHAAASRACAPKNADAGHESASGA